MERKHSLVIEHVNNVFIVRMDGKTFITRGRKKMELLIGKLVVTELMAGAETENMRKFEISEL